jgi:hypothetical protein
MPIAGFTLLAAAQGSMTWAWDELEQAQGIATWLPGAKILFVEGVAPFFYVQAANAIAPHSKLIASSVMATIFCSIQALTIFAEPTLFDILVVALSMASAIYGVVSTDVDAKRRFHERIRLAYRRWEGL